MYMDIAIRPARREDAGACRLIYAPYVEKTAITFDYDVPSEEAFCGRMLRTGDVYPFLVADCSGTIAGYACCGVFKDRRAYDWSAEMTVYVRQDMHGMGIGRLLYEKLEKVCREMHLLNLNACIAKPKGDDPYLTDASERFHARMGYRQVGIFHDSGYIFGRWYDMVWMEKMLGDHPEKPEEIIKFPDLSEEALRRAGVRI